MKRTIYSLAGLTAVIAIAFLGWNLFRSQPAATEPASQAAAVPTEAANTETETEAGSAPAQSEPAVDTEPVTEPITGQEPALPETTHQAAPVVSPALAGRGGGGGYGGFGSGQGPFIDATLTLNTTLPDTTEAMVYQGGNPNDNNAAIDLDAVRAFAGKMGVQGDLYFEWYAGIPKDGQNDDSGNRPFSYRIFDGDERITAYPSGEMFYENVSLISQSGQAPLPFAERLVIAEQFGQEHGILDFPYEAHPAWGNEVQFLPLFSDRPVANWSQITISVTGAGEVATVSIRPLATLTEGEMAALRTAEEAWQYVQENLADGPLYFNIIASDPAFYAPPVPVGQKTNWQREFAPGQEVSINGWLQVYRPVDGSITPYIVTDRGITLAGDAETLEAIAEATTSGNNINLHGMLSGEPDRLILNVTDWQQIVGPSDIYLTGATRQEEDGIALELPGGFRIQIANPPADLPLDTVISMSSWGVRYAEDGVSAVSDWVSLDLVFGPHTEPTAPIPDPFSGISEVTINQVDLAYHFVFPFEVMLSTSTPYATDDNSHLVPVWRFSGETNKGDLVEIMVPAPAGVELMTNPTE